MKQMFSAGLVLLATLGLFSPAGAADQVPFQGVFYPVITSQTPIPGTSQVQLTIELSGHATQLGDFTGSATATLDMNTFCYYGSGCQVSPNGKDSICGAFIGCFVPTADPCMFTNVETVTVTGGTGRFLNATGNHVDGGAVNFCTGENVGTFTGTVSRPHAP